MYYYVMSNQKFPFPVISWRAMLIALREIYRHHTANVV